MILVTIVVVVIFGAIELRKNGSRLHEIKLIENTYADALSYSVYAYEGIGIILPIQEVSKSPETYYKVVIAVILSVLVGYMFFGQFCCMAWGNSITPLITDELENIQQKWIGQVVILLFSLNLVFSYPLVLYPAHLVIE